MIYNSLAELINQNPRPSIALCLSARYGKNNRVNRYIYTKCPVCETCRWVNKYFVDRPWFTGYCASCNGIRNGKLNLKLAGKYIDCDGYRRVRIEPDSTFYSMTSRRYILEHRLVMAQYFGRPLISEEHVHHINGIKTDNRIENLKLTTRLEHTRDEWAELKELRTCVAALKSRNTQLEAEIVLLRAQLEEDGLNGIDMPSRSQGGDA